MIKEKSEKATEADWSKVELSIHDWQKKVCGYLKVLDELPAHNKKLILDFHRSYSIKNGLSLPRQCKYLTMIKTISQILKKPLDKIDDKDVDNLLIYLRENNYRPHTIKDYKVVLRVFLRNLDDAKFAKILARKDLRAVFSMKERESMRINPTDVLTRDEKIALLNACNNPRDLALVGCLISSGCRISELGNARIKDVAFDDDGYIIWVTGSKGTPKRPVRCVIDRQYMFDWLNKHHPMKSDQYAPVWVNLNGSTGQMKYQTIRKMLRGLKEKTGIRKRVNPHWFRHTQFTELLSSLPQAIVEKQMGVVPGSKVISTYSHVGYDVVREKIDARYGKGNGNNSESIAKQLSVEPKKCFGCGRENAPNYVYCEGCKLPLDPHKIVEENAKRQQMMKEELIRQIAAEIAEKVKEDLKKELAAGAYH